LESFCKILAVKGFGESIASDIASILSLISFVEFLAMKMTALKAYSVDFENIELFFLQKTLYYFTFH
jgi:hypothetical protein